MRHGLSTTRFYGIWEGIITRTGNRTHPKFISYGGRGIKNEWSDFKRFKDDMYDSYLKHVDEHGTVETQIDRIDNNGNYCKRNCRWATRKEQAQNRRNNTRITYAGTTMLLKDWSHKTGIERRTLSRRLKKGWSIHEALTTPKNGRYKFREDARDAQE